VDGCESRDEVALDGVSYALVGKRNVLLVNLEAALMPGFHK
jgi:hypothetical protein